jgi:hypothetical protein
VVLSLVLVFLIEARELIDSSSSDALPVSILLVPQTYQSSREI